MKPIYFITGIDTDAGKTIVTGALARYLKHKGVNVITQKLAQTGCVGESEDILTHRNLMQTALFPEDRDGSTCPYIFSFPSSPHLAAAKEGKTIQPAVLTAATQTLSDQYECVLVEGVGGLMVPLNDDVLLTDYLQECGYPVLLVTGGRVGSINHTLMSLDVCFRRGIDVVGLIFNHFGAADPTITADTISVFRKRLHQYYPNAKMVGIPVVEGDGGVVDFADLFE